jgi:hypothetical protein
MGGGAGAAADVAAAQPPPVEAVLQEDVMLEAGEPAASQPPVMSTFLKQIVLLHSGDLKAWAPVFKRLPALECVEGTATTAEVEDLHDLPEVLPSFTGLRTLNLPNVGVTGGAVLRALLQVPTLQHVQVGGAGMDREPLGSLDSG